MDCFFLIHSEQQALFHDSHHRQGQKRAKNVSSHVFHLRLQRQARSNINTKPISVGDNEKFFNNLSSLRAVKNSDFRACWRWLSCKSVVRTISIDEVASMQVLSGEGVSHEMSGMCLNTQLGVRVVHNPCNDSQKASVPVIWNEGRELKEEAREAPRTKSLRPGSVDLCFYLEREREEVLKHFFFCEQWLVMACVLKRSLTCGEFTEEGVGKDIWTLRKEAFVEIVARDADDWVSREAEKHSGCWRQRQQT